MMDREQVIEKAAKAIHASVISASQAGAIEISVGTEGIDFETALARVAFAVFEKAYKVSDRALFLANLPDEEEEHE